MSHLSAKLLSHNQCPCYYSLTISISFITVFEADFYLKLCVPSEGSCSVAALVRLAFIVMIGIWPPASVNLFSGGH